MSFAKIYAESAFTALGSNHVRRETLRQAILADATLTPAEALENIRIENAGSQTPESPIATGRTWAFIFAGAGPLSGPETTALDAIVAAHTGVWTEPASPSHGGSGGKIWSWNSGTPGWVDPPGGLSGLGAVAGVIPRTVGIEGNTLASSPASISSTGTLTVQGTDAGASQPGLIVGHNGGSNERIALYGLDTTPQLAVTHDPAIGIGVAIDKVVGPWYNFGASSGNAEWYQVATPMQISGFRMSWVSTTGLALSAGWLTDSLGKVHRKASVSSLSASNVAIPLGLDTGSLTANRWYYVWMIRNNAGVYSFVYSLSASAPTLSAVGFTATGYVAIARVGSFRTDAGSTSFIRFFQTGVGNTRKYSNDDASAGYTLISAGIATVATTVGNSGGAGALPSTAIEFKARVSTNASAAAMFRYSTAMVNTFLCRVPVGAIDVEIVLPCLSGTTAYLNSAGSGSTTAVVSEYTEEVPA